MARIKHTPHKSSLGIDANLVILIVWFGAFVLSLIEPISFLSFTIPFIILFIEKESALVKQHAIQAITLFIFNIIATLVIFIFPLLGLLFWIIAMIELGLIVIAAQRGWYYQEYELPFIQPLAKLVKKLLLR
ncbi:MAG TPA: DUF4870 domain-containing protein [Erysipelotrichaceae bacterium]|nr:DUF4870 domain-containing protein [Erysipelotrichaceae bacterium]